MSEEDENDFDVMDFSSGSEDSEFDDESADELDALFWNPLQLRSDNFDSSDNADTLQNQCVEYIANNIQLYEKEGIKSLPSSLIQKVTDSLSAKDLIRVESVIQECNISTEKAWTKLLRSECQQQFTTQLIDSYNQLKPMPCAKTTYWHLYSNSVISNLIEVSHENWTTMLYEELSPYFSAITSLSLYGSHFWFISSDMQVLDVLRQHLKKLSISLIRDRHCQFVSECIDILLRDGNLQTLEVVTFRPASDSLKEFLKVCAGCGFLDDSDSDSAENPNNCETLTDPKCVKLTDNSQEDTAGTKLAEDNAKNNKESKCSELLEDAQENIAETNSGNKFGICSVNAQEQVTRNNTHPECVSFADKLQEETVIEINSGPFESCQVSSDSKVPNSLKAQLVIHDELCDTDDTPSNFEDSKNLEHKMSENELEATDDDLFDTAIAPSMFHENSSKTKEEDKEVDISDSAIDLDPQADLEPLKVGHMQGLSSLSIIDCDSKKLVRSLAEVLPQWTNLKFIKMETTNQPKPCNSSDWEIWKQNLHDRTLDGNLEEIHLSDLGLPCRFSDLIMEFIKPNSRKTPMKMVHMEDVAVLTKEARQSQTHDWTLGYQFTGVRDLRVIDCGITPADLQTLLYITRWDQALRKFRLKQRRMKDHDLTQILQAICEQGKLTHLNLRKTLFGSVSVTKICPMLTELKTLTVLDISYCEIPAELVSSDAFVQIVVEHSRLASLTIAGNVLGNSACKLLKAVLLNAVKDPNHSLKALDISYNKINSKSLLQVAEDIASLDCSDSQKPLNFLNLSGNFLTKHHQELLEGYEKLVEDLVGLSNMDFNIPFADYMSQM